MAPYLDDMSSPAPAEMSRPTPGPAAGGNDLDDLYDYDAGLDEVFRDIEPPKAANSMDASRKDRVDNGLGIDKEVEVAKKPRVPRVKLDEDRLLSKAGISKLRKRAGDLKFKGKGHEYSDAARLLSLYQLWLDDLFPKAKFLDALAMVEKLGHKRRIQAARMEWIDEGKPKDSVHEDSIFDDPVLPPREVSNQNTMPARVAPIFEKSREGRPKTPDLFMEMDEDLYDATPRVPLAESNDPSDPKGESNSLFGPKKSTMPDEPEDDLDVLLAEQEMEGMNAAKGLSSRNQDKNMTDSGQNFEDDMEAMNEMGMDEMEGW